MWAVFVHSVSTLFHVESGPRIWNGRHCFGADTFKFPTPT